MIYQTEVNDGISKNEKAITIRPEKNTPHYKHGKYSIEVADLLDVETIAHMSWLKNALSRGRQLKVTTPSLLHAYWHC